MRVLVGVVDAGVFIVADGAELEVGYDSASLCIGESEAADDPMDDDGEDVRMTFGMGIGSETEDTPIGDAGGGVGAGR